MDAYEEAIQFERRVAAIFRTLGATVEHNVALAGNQIDILVSELTQSGATIRSAVECKAYARPVGVNTVNALAGLALLMRNRGLIDRAVLVSRSGFTVQARTAAKEHGIDLLELADLEQRVRGRESEISKAEIEVAQEDMSADTDKSRIRPKRAFVVMPFSPEYNDVYVLGIREVAEQLGMIVERADDIEHNLSIPDVITSSIASCDIVIADTSLPNPNVFYEVGLAHGMDKSTILICRDAETIPFDLAVVNHVIYSSIVELRGKLKSRLCATLGISAS